MPRKKAEPVQEPEPVPEPEPVKVKKPRAKKVVVPPVETVAPVVVEEVKEVKEVKEAKRKGTPKPRKQSKWMTALKEFNKNNDKYCIPKKGTSEYDAVIKLMESMSM